MTPSVRWKYRLSTINRHIMEEPTQIWTKTLSELQLQMTRATFDTWLRDTRCIELNGDGRTLVVAVKNSYAIEWLEYRLNQIITRTLARVAGDGYNVRYVVATPATTSAQPQDDAPASEPPSPATTPAPEWIAPESPPPGFAAISNYALKFWAPLLGQNAWRVWELCREADKRGRNRTEWTPVRRWKISALAAAVPCAVSTLVGVDRRCHPDTPGARRVEAVETLLEELRAAHRRGDLAAVALGDIVQRILDDHGAIPFPPPQMRLIREAALAESYESLRALVSDGLYRVHRDGALDVLQREGAAQVEAHGRVRHSTYLVSVRVELGWLHPSQVTQLSPSLQIEHDEFLAHHGYDPGDWL